MKYFVQTYNTERLVFYITLLSVASFIHIYIYSFVYLYVYCRIATQIFTSFHIYMYIYPRIDIEFRRMSIVLSDTIVIGYIIWFHNYFIS